MSDPYQEQIKNIISTKGPQGVNSLSRIMDVPVSTIHRYLERQNYFVKNQQRKWDTPDNAARVEAVKTQDNFKEVIDNQLAGIDSLFELMSNNLRSTINLLKSQQPTPVAKPAPKLHPRIADIDDQIKKMEKVLKDNKHKIPQQYRELFDGLDIYHLTIEKGAHYIREPFSNELANILLGQETTLSDEFVTMLRAYQL